MFQKRINSSRHIDAAAFVMDDLEDRMMLSAARPHTAVNLATVRVPRVTHSALHATRAVVKAVARVTVKPAVKVAAKVAAKPAAKVAAKPVVKAVATTTTEGTEMRILFSAAPAAVQTGLQALAPTGFTIPATQSIEVDTPVTGLATYSTELRTTGIDSHIAVDANGAALISSGGGEHGGNDNGGQDNGGQDNGGQDNGGRDNGNDNGGVDNNGNDVLFSAVPAIVQTALQSQAPAGVTIAATQEVDVSTNASNVLVYVTRVVANGIKTTLAVDATGGVVTVPVNTEGDHQGRD